MLLAIFCFCAGLYYKLPVGFFLLGFMLLLISLLMMGVGV